MTTGPFRTLGAGLSCVLLAAACSNGVRPLEARCRTTFPDATLKAARVITVAEVRDRVAAANQTGRPGSGGPALVVWPEYDAARPAALCSMEDLKGPFVVAVVDVEHRMYLARGTFPQDPNGLAVP
jgi:hypothetical protein